MRAAVGVGAARDDIDVTRGDLIAADAPAGTEPAASVPEPTRDVRATVCHLADRPLRAGDRVLLRHTTRVVKAVVTEISHRVDVTTLAAEPGTAELRANDLARVVLRTAAPIAADDYAGSRECGAFLLLDETDGDTLTAGMIGPAWDGGAGLDEPDGSRRSDGLGLDLGGAAVAP